jgi:hypothetical protein
MAQWHGLRLCSAAACCRVLTGCHSDTCHQVVINATNGTAYGPQSPRAKGKARLRLWYCKPCGTHRDKPWGPTSLETWALQGHCSATRSRRLFWKVSYLPSCASLQWCVGCALNNCASCIAASGVAGNCVNTSTTHMCFLKGRSSCCGHH